MPEKTKIARVGFGNIGKAVLRAVNKNNKLHGDMEPVGIITRDPPRVLGSLGGYHGISPGQIYNVDNVPAGLDVDVAILCGGSKNDLPKQGPYFANRFNTVDSFDTHAHIKPYVDKDTGVSMPGYLADMDVASRGTGHTAAISIGWDPGTFSDERVAANAFLPGVRAYAFYGLTERGGLSMGHSDAIRTIGNVIDAKSYTHASPEAIERVRSGENPNLAPGDMHWRENFIALGNDTPKERARVESEIETMPDYFKDYKTTATFLTQRELDEGHKDMPHDGLVLAVGENGETIEYKNVWPNNPTGTAGILVAHARAIQRMNREGKIGAHRSIDIPKSYISPHSDKVLTADFM